MRDSSHTAATVYIGRQPPVQPFACFLSGCSAHLLFGQVDQVGHVAARSCVQRLSVRAQDSALLIGLLADLEDGCMPLLAPLCAAGDALWMAYRQACERTVQRENGWRPHSGWLSVRLTKMSLLHVTPKHGTQRNKGARRRPCAASKPPCVEKAQRMAEACKTIIQLNDMRNAERHPCRVAAAAGAVAAPAGRKCCCKCLR